MMKRDMCSKKLKQKIEDQYKIMKKNLGDSLTEARTTLENGEFERYGSSQNDASRLVAIVKLASILFNLKLQRLQAIAQMEQMIAMDKMQKAIMKKAVGPKVKDSECNPKSCNKCGP